jgi:hypothetical protein
MHSSSPAFLPHVPSPSMSSSSIWSSHNIYAVFSSNTRSLRPSLKCERPSSPPT